MIWSNFFKSISNNMVYNTNEASPYFKLLGFILLLSYGFFYLFNKIFINPFGDENLYLRILICVLGILLILHKYWAKKYTKFVPIFFYFTLFISFGFFFSYMLFKNPYSNIWQINELTGLVLLAIFVDWRSFIVLTTLSITSATLLTEKSQLFDYVYLMSIFCSYSAPIICLLLFAQMRQNHQNERADYIEKIKELNRSLELKVTERTKELNKALAVKTEFLNNISHEIRTPLNGFLNISEGLVEHWYRFEDHAKYNYAIQVSSSAQRLFSLVNNILDLSKLTHNKMSMNLEKTLINDLIKDVIQECNLLYLDRKVIDIIFIPAEDIIINIDPYRMKQVFRNLFYNAIKFTPENGKICINIEDRNNEIYISISDTGIGIPIDELEDIFNSFTQSSLTKTRAGGTGLGLSIVKNIIQAHHGKIWAENNPVVGSIFHILLPK